MALFNVTNKTGNSSIKAIQVSDTGFDSCSEPIPTDFNTTLYFTGAGNWPVPGDEVYKDSKGVFPWTSADEPQDRRIEIWDINLKVDSSGITQLTC